jgi:Dolichyl-phosphate-mannose-protein mannosyltransferase
VPTVAAVSQPAAQPTVDATNARGARSWWVLAASAAALIAITIWNSLHKSLWIDEAYSFHTATRTLAATWHQAIHFETQPPLYFILLNLWLRLGSPSVHWMRGLSALAAIGCIVFLWATRPAHTGHRGVPASVFAVVTATVVWAAAEARPYSLALLFSAWTMYYFVRIMDRQDDRSWLDATLYAIGAYAGLMTFYYVGFLLVGQWIAAVVLQRGRRWLTIGLTAVALAFAPWLSVVHDQLTRNINPVPAIVAQPAMRYLAGGPSTSPPAAFLAGVFGDSPVLTQTSFGAIVIGGMILFVALLRFVVPDRGLQRATAATTSHPPDAYASSHDLATYRWLEPALFVTLAAPAIGLLGLQFSNIVSVYPRHLTCLTAPFILLCTLWTARIAPGVWRWVGGSALIAAALLALVSYERHVDVADSRGAAAYVAQHDTAGEPILVIGPEAVLPFRYYYTRDDRGQAPVFGIPIDASLDTYDPVLFDLRDTSQIGKRMRDAGGPNRYWMVVSQGFVWHTAPADSIVTSFLRARATVLDSTTFTNVYVIHAVRR